MSQRSVPIYGDGQQKRDWIYVEDNCSALWSVLQKGQIGHSYNIGANNELTNNSLVHTLCSIMDKKLLSQIPPKSSDLITYVEDRLGHDRRYSIDSSKIRKEIGWRCKFDFLDSLEKTVDWYISNQPWLKNADD